MKIKRYVLWAIIGILFVGFLGSIGSSKTDVQGVQTEITPTIQATATPTLTPVATNTPIPTATNTPVPTKKPVYIAPTAKSTPIPTETTQSNDLSNDDYYTNVDGNEVHSPVYSDTVPAGATAICGDGTYSFSQNRRGTCSHHGGVAQWL